MEGCSQAMAVLQEWRPEDKAPDSALPSPMACVQIRSWRMKKLIAVAQAQVTLLGHRQNREEGRSQQTATNTQPHTSPGSAVELELGGNELKLTGNTGKAPVTYRCMFKAHMPVFHFGVFLCSMAKSWASGCNDENSWLCICSCSPLQ